MTIATAIGLRVSGSRATEIIPMPEDRTPWVARRIAVRNMSTEDFIETKGSGTLRKNHAIGMNVTSHALHERVAYEFGYAFETCPERFVTWGEARSEPDEKAMTEVGWHVERYASFCLFPGDEMECKYITVEIGGVKREGVGVVIRKTSVPWIPPGYIIFAIIAELDQKTHEWKPAVNPC